ncbi:MAG TPA: hypothetical protein VF652_10915 [Allosphingosinicella sp.]|jgi:hypothetical protein
MRIINVLAAVSVLSLAGGVAVAKEKSAAPKEKKICRIVEPAVGRIPARRICTVKTEAPAVAAKAKPSDVEAGASGGRD